MIDLHTHSSASDGSLTPRQLIAEAHSRGISAIALTDHDTIDGNDEAAAAADTLGIHFIPGIELEIQWEPGEFHLLGLGIKNPSGDFLEALRTIAEIRKQRNLGILEKMQEMGISADYGDIKAMSEGNTIGRPHFAAFLVERRVVKNREQAFSRYLGKGRPLYIPKEGLAFRRAVEMIKESGGIAVLAHPMSLYVSWGRLPGLIADLKDQGLDGIEAWHPTAKPRACKRLEELGLRLGLYISAGSDFHGASRPDRKLGISSGGRKIEDSVLEAIPPLHSSADNIS
ncbi:PHP domain-containing protein [Treponema sp. OttesenSCG-928-L16]|nr:PHP domain-containing protein [Treponema sp. OttesenSCG-928-L16]